MKRLEARVAKESESAVESVLVSAGLIYGKQEVDSESGKAVLFAAVVPEEILGHAVDNISKQLDMRKKQNIILVSSLDAAISPVTDDLQKKAREAIPSLGPLESILQPLQKYLRPSTDIVVMLVVATVVALAGLFLDNVAVVIGAMLISPLLGPLNVVTVNAVLGNIKTVVRAEISLFSLVFISIAVAATITVVASTFIPLSLTDQILQRTHVTILDVMVALLLGVAGGLALLTEIPEILVGVAVAVAFIPPATVAGIALGLGRSDLFVGAFFLTISNLFGLKVGEMLTIKAKGLSPRSYYEIKKARIYGRYSLVIFLLIVALLLILVVTAVH
jgi:uncharacterized hydrophobic protein (TIGR00341 family)